MPNAKTNGTDTRLRSTHIQAITFLILLISLTLLLPGKSILAAPPPPAAASIYTTVDNIGVEYSSTSIALNSSGFPVLVYRDTSDDTNGVLKLAMCRDATCTNPLFKTLNPGFAGAAPSLLLNNSGFPVIAYSNWIAPSVNIAVCNNAACTNPALKTIDSSGLTMVSSDFTGMQPSLALDAGGNPIISYYESIYYDKVQDITINTKDLKLAVCHDTTCQSFDLITVDSFGDVGRDSSIKLNDSGLPVISYTGDSLASPFGKLKVAVCNNMACNNPTKRFIDTTGDIQHTSLELNSSGNPVISYYDKTTRDLKLAICNDETCAVKTIITVDSVGDIGEYTSLSLNTSGFPVISYYDALNNNTKVAVCNDAECSNPTITAVDSTANVTDRSDMVLNSSGIPVLGYNDATNGVEKVAICNMCMTPTLTAVDSPGSVGPHTSLALKGNGNPVISYVEINTALKVAVCKDAYCSQSTRVIVDDTARFEYTSLALNSSNFPVISYYDADNQDLELAICTNRTCTNRTLKTIDSTGLKGKYSSLALNSSGFAVISYYDESAFDLRLAVCNNADCTNPETFRVDGATSLVGGYTSMVLNSSGFPVISYYSWTGSKLMLAVCTDATCTSIPSIKTIDDVGTVGLWTSLALNSNGFPVISYYDQTEDDLKLAICNNATCTQPTITPVDTPGDVGEYTSLALTSSDFPIISYYDKTNNVLKVAVCSDTACETTTLTTVDGLGLVGNYTSMQLNDSGYPVISYYDGSPNVNLKLAVLEPPSIPFYRVHLPVIMRNSQ